MTIPFKWDNEARTILYVDRTQKYDWDEFDRSVDETYVLITSVTHTVDMVIRIDSTTPIPANPMPHMKRMFQTKPNNLRFIIAIGAERTAYNFQTVMIEMMMRVFSSVAKQMRFASSLEDARALIARQPAPSAPVIAEAAQQT